MSFNSEQSRFTACLLGEGSPAEQSAFEAALLEDAALRAEALGLSRAGQRLAAALQEEALRGLNPPLREVRRPLVAPAVRRPARRSAWVGPTLATAALVAGALMGLAVLPESRLEEGAGGALGGIPTVSMQRSAPDRVGSLPSAAVPSVAAGGVVSGELPGLSASPAAGPVAGGAMAAVPPSREGLREAMAVQAGPLEALAPPPGASAGQAPPAGSLASPAPARP